MDDAEIRTDNDFAIAYNAGHGLVPLLPVQVTTKQQAYRVAAYIKIMGDLLPDEPVASTYDEVERAISNT
ncbi:hypothetical protein [Jiangella alkaliphila]|uniref:Uncharacterized protein n=1 Tax=Jiangella alkaliphila TaxID=419479 RepID=A0A1H2IEC3_9ACTN|nr:hypothetical protein [Jiangella alkaliphila]SDU42341.1 hypothetical protein SAMN04488563_1642 [Jiangella alkaliphila]